MKYRTLKSIVLFANLLAFVLIAASVSAGGGGDTCSNAEVLTISNGSVSATADMSSASATNPSGGCGNYVDVWYKVESVPAGSKVEFSALSGVHNCQWEDNGAELFYVASSGQCSNIELLAQQCSGSCYCLASPNSCSFLFNGVLPENTQDPYPNGPETYDVYIRVVKKDTGGANSIGFIVSFEIAGNSRDVPLTLPWPAEPFNFCYTLDKSSFDTSNLDEVSCWGTVPVTGYWVKISSPGYAQMTLSTEAWDDPYHETGVEVFEGTSESGQCAYDAAFAEIGWFEIEGAADMYILFNHNAQAPNWEAKVCVHEP